MPTLSLALIVKNESDTLGHCLASVQGLADQVVVVDTGSQDGTPDLARTWGPRFTVSTGAMISPQPERQPFPLHQRLILILDADEAVDARDHAVIRGALEAPEVHAYRLVLRNYYRSGSQSLFDSPWLRTRVATPKEPPSPTAPTSTASDWLGGTRAWPSMDGSMNSWILGSRPATCRSVR